MKRNGENTNLPCFDLAAKSGIDLHKLVLENPGKNCVILLIERLQNELRSTSPAPHSVC